VSDRDDSWWQLVERQRDGCQLYSAKRADGQGDCGRIARRNLVRDHLLRTACRNGPRDGHRHHHDAQYDDDHAGRHPDDGGNAGADHLGGHAGRYRDDTAPGGLGARFNV
jgi:hypothetical protein